MLFSGVYEMSFEIGEALIDYALLSDIDDAVRAKVIKRGMDSEIESRHVSLLDELMTPLDDKEVFVVTRNLIKYHLKDFLRILTYMKEQEGDSAND